MSVCPDCATIIFKSEGEIKVLSLVQRHLKECGVCTVHDVVSTLTMAIMPERTREKSPAAAVIVFGMIKRAFDRSFEPAT